MRKEIAQVKNATHDDGLGQCFGSELTLCGSGSSFLGECRPGSWINVKN
jgi:hypothetical protein